VTEITPDISWLSASTSPLPGTRRGAAKPGSDPAPSMENTVKDSIRTRKVAVLIEKGFDADALASIRKLLTDEGAMLETVSTSLGPLSSAQGESIDPDKTYVTTASVLYDAVLIPGGQHAGLLQQEGDALHFINE